MAETLSMNRQKALQNFGGDEEMLLNILSDWDEGNIQTNEMALRLHKGIMKENFEEIRIASHILRTGAAYASATRMEGLLVGLEAKAERKESMNLIRKDYMEFLDESRKVKKEIAQILKRPVSLNINDFDIFEKQVRAAFPEDFHESKISPFCQGCSIF